MKKISKILLAFVLFCVFTLLSGVFTQVFAAETDYSILLMNPKGDSDYAVYNGKEISIKNYYDKYVSHPYENDGYLNYSNPYNKNLRLAGSCHISNGEDDPIVAFVEKECFTNEGDYLLMGTEYGYFVSTKAIGKDAYCKHNWYESTVLLLDFSCYNDLSYEKEPYYFGVKVITQSVYYSFTRYDLKESRKITIKYDNSEASMFSVIFDLEKENVINFNKYTENQRFEYVVISAIDHNTHKMVQTSEYFTVQNIVNGYVHNDDYSTGTNAPYISEVLLSKPNGSSAQTFNIMEYAYTEYNGAQESNEIFQGTLKTGLDELNMIPFEMANEKVEDNIGNLFLDEDKIEIPGWINFLIRKAVKTTAKTIKAGFDISNNYRNSLGLKAEFYVNKQANALYEGKKNVKNTSVFALPENGLNQKQALEKNPISKDEAVYKNYLYACLQEKDNELNYQFKVENRTQKTVLDTCYSFTLCKQTNMNNHIFEVVDFDSITILENSTNKTINKNETNGTTFISNYILDRGLNNSKFKFDRHHNEFETRFATMNIKNKNGDYSEAKLNTISDNTNYITIKALKDMELTLQITPTIEHAKVSVYIYDQYWEETTTERLFNDKQTVTFDVEKNHTYTIEIIVDRLLSDDNKVINDKINALEKETLDLEALISTYNYIINNPKLFGNFDLNQIKTNRDIANYQLSQKKAELNNLKNERYNKKDEYEANRRHEIVSLNVKLTTIKGGC